MLPSLSYRPLKCDPRVVSMCASGTPSKDTYTRFFAGLPCEHPLLFHLPKGPVGSLFDPLYVVKLCLQLSKYRGYPGCGRRHFVVKPQADGHAGLPHCLFV